MSTNRPRTMKIVETATPSKYRNRTARERSVNQQRRRRRRKGTFLKVVCQNAHPPTIATREVRKTTRKTTPRRRATLTRRVASPTATTRNLVLRCQKGRKHRVRSSQKRKSRRRKRHPVTMKTHQAVTIMEPSARSGSTRIRQKGRNCWRRKMQLICRECGMSRARRSSEATRRKQHCVSASGGQCSWSQIIAVKII